MCKVQVQLHTLCFVRFMGIAFSYHHCVMILLLINGYVINVWTGMSSQIGLMRLATWNVNGLGNPVKRKKVMTMLKNKKYDVVFLQETHMSKEESEKLCAGWAGHVFYSIGSSKSKGVITLVSKHLQFKCLKQIKDNSGRMIIVLAEIQSQKMILANIYAPNLDDHIFFTDLERKLQTAGNHAVVLGGG